MCEWYGNSHSQPKSAGFNICIRLVYWIRSQGLHKTIQYDCGLCLCKLFAVTLSTNNKNHTRKSFNDHTTDCNVHLLLLTCKLLVLLFFWKTSPKTATFKIRNEPNDAECQLKGIRNIYIQILHHQPCIKDIVEILNSKTLRTLQIICTWRIYMWNSNLLSKMWASHRWYYIQGIHA